MTTRPAESAKSPHILREGMRWLAACCERREPAHGTTRVRKAHLGPGGIHSLRSASINGRLMGGVRLHGRGWERGSPFSERMATIGSVEMGTHFRRAKGDHEGEVRSLNPCRERTRVEYTKRSGGRRREGRRGRSAGRRAEEGRRKGTRGCHRQARCEAASGTFRRGASERGCTARATLAWRNDAIFWPRETENQRRFVPQQNLYFRPLLHGHGA